MEVATKPMDFNFNYSSSSCYTTSAPSSPGRLTELYCGFDELLLSAATAGARRTTSLASVPFAWEEKPGVPKGPTNLFGEDDFSFDVGCELSRDSSVPAEDLFQGGLIKPLGCQVEKKVERESVRGRERFCSSAMPSSRSRRTRSMSPLGGSDQRREQHLTATYMVAPSLGSTCSPPVFSSEHGSKKWSFMDLFLFRSASDGRAMDRDPLKKYSAIFRKHDQDIRNSSGTGSVSKRRGRVSAHELHYNVNRAVSNDMKRKTYLPYKQGILGRFSFNP